MPKRKQPSKAKPKVSAKSDHPTRQSRIIKLLERPKGATFLEISKATGWQEHSVRGFVSGTLKKRLGLAIESFKDAKGARRYRIEAKNTTSNSKRDIKGGDSDASPNPKPVSQTSAKEPVSA